MAASITPTTTPTAISTTPATNSSPPPLKHGNRRPQTRGLNTCTVAVLCHSSTTVIKGTPRNNQRTTTHTRSCSPWDRIRVLITRLTLTLLSRCAYYVSRISLLLAWSYPMVRRNTGAAREMLGFPGPAALYHDSLGEREKLELLLVLCC